MNYEEKRKIRLKNNLYKLALISVVVVVIWIAFEIYFSYQSQNQELSITAAQIEPISPQLNLETAQRLNNRLNINQATLDNFKQNARTQSFLIESIDLDTSASPSPLPPPTISTSSATPQVTPTP